MKKNFNKILVLITLSVFMSAFVVLFWIEAVHPKKIDVENGLAFGNRNSSVKVVVFEDFKCRFCKEFSENYLPAIRQKYIDSDRISYMIVPLAFLQGSKMVANAAVIIYEMNKSLFFDFLKIISEENINIENQKDLIEIAKRLKGINMQIFEEFLKKEIYDNYLEDNLENAKKILKPFQVPSIFLNGHSIEMKEISGKIEEMLNYGVKK